MTETDIEQLLREMRYPATVDVVAPVMEQIRNKPLLTAQPTRFRIKRVATIVAACFLLAVGINLILLYTQDYDETQISNMLVDVYNYHANYDNMAEASFDIASIEIMY